MSLGKEIRKILFRGQTDTTDVSVSGTYVPVYKPSVFGKKLVGKSIESIGGSTPLVNYNDTTQAMPNLPIYADNAAALTGGLVQGQLYINNEREVKTVVTNYVGKRVYKALLTQSGTDAPTAIVLENTLGEVPTFTRTVAGTYRLNVVANLIDPFKISVSFGSLNSTAISNEETLYYNLENTPNSIEFKILSNIGLGIDGMLINMLILFEVYP